MQTLILSSLNKIFLSVSCNKVHETYGNECRINLQRKKWYTTKNYHILWSLLKSSWCFLLEKYRFFQFYQIWSVKQICTKCHHFYLELLYTTFTITYLCDALKALHQKKRSYHGEKVWIVKPDYSCKTDTQWYYFCRINSPCPGCEKAYGFRNVLPLNLNATLFKVSPIL